MGLRSAAARITVQRIARAAARRFGREGFNKASVTGVAEEAGVSRGKVRRHFPNKEVLLIEAQRVTFQEVALRFNERANRGETGLPAALDGLDALWHAVHQLKDGAPFIVETLALTTRGGTVAAQLQSFYAECTAMLEDALMVIFAEDLERLTLPPNRMAVIIRIMLEGLVVELAQARSQAEVDRVNRAYQDMRQLFAQFALQDGVEQAPTFDEAQPLPW